MIGYGVDLSMDPDRSANLRCRVPDVVEDEPALLRVDHALEGWHAEGLASTREHDGVERG